MKTNLGYDTKDYAIEIPKIRYKKSYRNAKNKLYVIEIKRISALYLIYFLSISAEFAEGCKGLAKHWEKWRRYLY